MAIKCTIVHGMPDDAFWYNFEKLWRNSADRSPFKSPNILRYFAGVVRGHIHCFQFYVNGELHGAILLKDDGRVLSFLSDLKTDVNFFVLDQQCTPDEEKQFFDFFFSTIKQNNWSVVLNNQPSWAHYMPAFEAAGKSSGLFWLNFAYSVCPIAVDKTPDALFERINGSRELRYRVNKLKKQGHATFEALTDDSELDYWADEFCQAHILRWSDTPTPSAFRDPARRQFLKDCLRAWSADGILVRFSVKVESGRIGFVIGLLEKNSLVHHSTTFHPDYWKYSPGKALIHFMAEWMRERDMNMLDFGDGNEPYKYDVANQEHVLNRIFICAKTRMTFIAKAKFIKYVKDHPQMYHLYQNKLKIWASRAAAVFHLPDILEMFAI